MSDCVRIPEVGTISDNIIQPPKLHTFTPVHIATTQYKKLDTLTTEFSEPLLYTIVIHKTIETPLIYNVIPNGSR